MSTQTVALLCGIAFLVGCIVGLAASIAIDWYARRKAAERHAAWMARQR